MRRIFFFGERKEGGGGVFLRLEEGREERTGNRTDVGTDGRTGENAIGEEDQSLPQTRKGWLFVSFVSFRREIINRICETGAREPRKETTIPPLPGSQASHGSKEDRSSQHLQVLIC